MKNTNHRFGNVNVRAAILWTLILSLMLCALPVASAGSTNMNDHWGYHVTSFNYDGNDFTVKGHFYNDNQDITIKHLSNFSMGLFDAGSVRYLSFNANEGSLYDIALAPGSEYDYTFKGTCQGLNLNGYDMSHITTGISCDYQYVWSKNPVTQPTVAPTGGWVPIPTLPPYFPTPKQCPNCGGQGWYTCKACGGAGYFDRKFPSALSNKCAACNNGITSCYECGGDGWK